MATELMNQTRRSKKSQPAKPVPDLDPAIQSIIQKARRSTPRTPARGAIWLTGLSALLMYVSFPPLNWSACAWLALVPLMLLIRMPQPTRWMYSILYAGGVGFFLPAFQWMRLGDPTMYVAWVALSLYLAVYFPIFVGLSRIACHRLRLPLVLAAPVVWVGLEYIRAHLITGVSWYYLGHTQYRWIELIQISDLVGAYGVSLVMAVAAAGLAVLAPVRIYERWKLVGPASLNALVAPRRSVIMTVGTSVGLLVLCLGYGTVRRSQVTFEPGPRVALIQGNFPTSVKHDPEAAQEIFNEHYMLSMAAVQKGSPDLVVWPETMFRNPLFSLEADLTAEQIKKVAPEIPAGVWSDPTTPTMLHEMSQEMNAGLLVGLEAVVMTSDRIQHFNSSAFITPDNGVTGRYDKIHRVPFGEYIPLRDELPILGAFTPFGPDFGIDPGHRAVVFGYRDWNLASIICFEDTVPHLVRNIVDSTRDPESDREIDLLVNHTNDGWFHGSSELDQHLITAAFRCVECRVPMVRAVNTGISAVIDGDGVIRDPLLYIDGDQEGRDSLIDPETGRWRKQISAALVDQVPLDPRSSVYVRTGDLFAGSCGLSCGLLLVCGLIPRRRNADSNSILPS